MGMKKVQKVMLCCATRLELVDAMEAIRLAKKLDLRYEYLAMFTGVGKVCAAISTARLSPAFCEAKAFVGFGYAGASENFEIGSIVVPRNAKNWDARLPESFEDKEIEPLLNPLKLQPDVSLEAVQYVDYILTGDSFVEGVQGDEMLRKAAGGDYLVDMETTGLVAGCDVQDVDSFVVKAVSDHPKSSKNGWAEWSSDRMKGERISSLLAAISIIDDLMEVREGWRDEEMGD